MNKALFKYSLLLRLSQFGKLEFTICLLLFVSFLASIDMKMDIKPQLEGICQPVIILYTGWTFAQDSSLNQNSLNNGEYFSLLFTRPISRFSYVITKALVIAMGSLSMISTFLGLFLLAQLVLMVPQISFIDGWQIATLLANAWSFGCLLILLRVLPTKIGTLLFLVCLCGSFGTMLSFTLLPKEEMNTAMQFWETLSLIFRQLFYPAIDCQTIFEREPFSYVPLVTYVSNCLLYLLGATVIINRREFTYAQN
jgi:hypothetical protein